VMSWSSSFYIMVVPARVVSHESTMRGTVADAVLTGSVEE
jgi:hypothetical protein